MKKVLLACLLVLLVSACPGGSGGQAGPSPTPSPDPAPEPQPGPQPRPSPSEVTDPPVTLSLSHEFPLDITDAKAVAVDAANNLLYINDGGVLVFDLAKGYVVRSHHWTYVSGSQNEWNTGSYGKALVTKPLGLFSGPPTDIELYSGKVYFTSGQGFHVLDPQTGVVTDVVITTDPLGFAGRIHIVGRKAYVITGGITIVPGVTSPESPYRIVVVDLDTLQVSDFHAYGGNPVDIKIVGEDVFVPTNVDFHNDKLSGHNNARPYTTCKNPTGIAVDGDFAYLSCDSGTNGLVVYRGMTTLNIQEHKAYAKVAYGQAVRVHNGKVYVAANSSSIWGEVSKELGGGFGLYIVDPSKPDSQAVESFPGIGEVKGIDISGDKVYLATSNGACDLVIFDTGTKKYRRVCGVGTTGIGLDSSAAFAVTPEKLYVGTNTPAFGLRIIDRTTHAITPVNLPYVKAVRYLDDRVYLPSDLSFIKLDPQSFQTTKVGVFSVGETGGHHAPFSWAFEGGKAFVIGAGSCTAKCLSVIDLATLTIVKQPEGVDTGQMGAMAVAGDFLYLAGRSYGLKKMNLSDYSITSADEIVGGDKVDESEDWSLFVDGGMLYVGYTKEVTEGDSTNDIVVLKSVNPGTGSVTQVAAWRNPPYGFHFSGVVIEGKLYTGGSNGGNYVVDLGDGSMAKLIGEGGCWGDQSSTHCLSQPVGYDPATRTLFSVEGRLLRSYSVP